MNIFKDITLIYAAHKSDSIIKKNIDIIKLFNVIIVDNSNSLDLKNYLSDFDNIEQLLEYFELFNENLSKKTLNSYIKSVNNP